MGIHTLEGTEDGGDRALVMYDSSSGWAFGPLWKSIDAEEQIAAFLGWMDKEMYVLLAEKIGLSSGDLPSPLLRASDPRGWPDSGLAKLLSYWRATHLDENGLLLDPVPA